MEIVRQTHGNRSPRLDAAFRIHSMSHPPYQPPYTTDTSPEAHAVQLELLRRMSPDERLEKAFSLSNGVRRMAMDAIRRRHPDFDEVQVRIKFIELTYGKELADGVRLWRQGGHLE